MQPRSPAGDSPRELPTILSADEVVRFLEAAPSLKTHTILNTVNGPELRATATVSLKVADIESRVVIQVCQGKHVKERSSMLSLQLLTILRRYWRLARTEM